LSLVDNRAIYKVMCALFRNTHSNLMHMNQETEHLANCLNKTGGMFWSNIGKEMPMTSRTGPLPSTNLAMIAMIVSHASKAFGSEVISAEWLRTPNPYLDDRTPIACMDQESGIESVRQLLNAIERGGVA
jgi:hypothetical protein